MLGGVARPSTETDLLTLSVGMILGLLIGGINVPVGGFKVGLGNAGGLLLSGIIVSSVVSRLRFFGSTPNAARNILEDLGLVAFVAIVGINAGASLLAQLTGAVALKIFLVGFIACTIPPFVTWALGYHLFKINPAVLMGGVAGARSHSRTLPRGRQGDRQLGAVGRIPGRLCRLGRPAHDLWLFRDDSLMVVKTPSASWRFNFVVAAHLECASLLSFERLASGDFLRNHPPDFDEKKSQACRQGWLVHNLRAGIGQYTFLQ